MAKEVKKQVKTRDRILDAATELFAENGFKGTTTREIAERAAVNEAMIFKHFSTKKDLYSAIIDRKISLDLSSDFTQIVVKKKDDREVFRSVAMRLIEKSENSLLRLLHFSALEGHELSDIFFETYVYNLTRLLSEYISQRLHEGAFKHINPTLAARIFIGMVVNYVVGQELFGEKKRWSFNKEEVVETLLNIFLDGIRRKI